MILPHGGNSQSLRTAGRRGKMVRTLAGGGHVSQPIPPPPNRPIPSSFRRRTSPAFSRWAMCSTTPSRIFSRAAREWKARKCFGCRARITPASPPRRWSNGNCARTKAKTRHDLGREEFLKRVWEWKEKHGGIIIEQLKRLGCSCDWSRERFTMDAAYSRAVQQAFVDLYQKGLIYRGKRMVNWDPVARTALSDEEVIMKPQKGVALLLAAYEMADEPGRLSRQSPRPGRKRSWATRRWP